MPRTASFKGLNDWIEVFRAGTHTDSKGRTCAFTEGDLDQMVANVADFAPPAVIGHPKDTDPAYAWAREVRRDGDTLLAKFSDINPAFAAGVDSGAYRNRSVSVTKDAAKGWRLQHVGFLGAVPPAIAGLAPLQYSAPVDVEIHEFALGDIDECLMVANAIDNIGTLLRGLRDYVISKDGLDVANTVLSDWQITSIAQSADALRAAALQGASNPTFSNPTDASMNFTQQDVDRAAQEAAERARTDAQAQFASQTQQLTQLQTERQTERIGTQIAAWKTGGQVLPAEEPGLAQFMAALEDGTSAEFNFSAADKSAQTATPAKFFSEFVGRRSALVKLGKTVTGDPAPATGLDTNDAHAIADAARQYKAAEAKNGREISIDVAVSHVTRNANTQA